MPLWVPNKAAILIEDNFGTVGALTLGTAVTTGGTAATKGTAVQLIASTAFDTYMVRIFASDYGAAATTSRGCLDILVGAATEEVLIPNLLMGFCGSYAGSVAGHYKQWEFPLFIPAGTRIAAQVAGDRTTTAMRVGIQLIGGTGVPPWQCGTRVVTYGIGTVPAATAITPGSSAAEGAWTQITASTTEPCIAIVPSLQGPTGDTTLSAYGCLMDIGVGAATEEIVAGNGREAGFAFAMGGSGTTGTEIMGGPVNPFPRFVNIPSGQRLSARVSRSAAADTVATLDVALHCVV